MSAEWLALLTASAFCLSNAMHSIGKIIKSPEHLCVHPCVCSCIQHLRHHIFITVAWSLWTTH